MKVDAEDLADVFAKLSRGERLDLVFNLVAELCALAGPFAVMHAIQVWVLMDRPADLGWLASEVHAFATVQRERWERTRPPRGAPS